jgi:hypothetical protein
MKRITSLVIQSLVTILIGGGILAGNLQAQTDLAMTVSIPFPFTVGTQSIAPGTYQFSLISSQFLLSVLNVKTGDKNVFPMRPGQQHAFESHGRLIFRNSDGCSTLSEIYFPGTDRFSEVSQRHSIGRPSTGNSISMARPECSTAGGFEERAAPDFNVFNQMTREVLV